MFIDKGDEYIKIILFIFKEHLYNCFSDELRLNYIQYFLKNTSIIKKSKIILTLFLSGMKPEKYNPKKYNKNALVNNFMNLEKKNISSELISICNEMDNPILNEVILHFFEGQCQSYFLEILEKNHNKYSEKCCEEMLLNISLDYLKKVIEYSDKNNKNNIILKLFSIAYIKTYCYFYVEINYNHFDKCNFDTISPIFMEINKYNTSTRNTRNLYIWKLYNKKFENFEQFLNFDFVTKNLPLFQELEKQLQIEKNNTKFIFNESFINSCFLLKDYKDQLIVIEKILKNNKNIKMNYDINNENFDLFYCVLVNKYISFIYGNEKNYYIDLMNKIYNKSNKYLKFNEEGKTLFNYLMNSNLLKNNIMKKISENPLTQNEFEILLYSLRFIFNTQISNKTCFYNDILKNTKTVINSNYIPGTLPKINEFEKSYNTLQNLIPLKRGYGYYICKDCGYLYVIPPSGFPMATA